MRDNIKKVILKIDGMVCVSCENLIEDILLDNDGVINVEASYIKNLAKIDYDENKISISDLIRIIHEEGYKIIDYNNEEIDEISINNKEKIKTEKNQPIDKRQGDTFQLIVIIIGIFLFLKRFGILNIFNAFPTPNENTSYGMLFIIGLFTSFHCVSMCGGINLSQCLNDNVASTKEKSSTIKPAFLYNLGRVISYTIFGGIVGGIGSVISFTGEIQGLIQLIVPYLWL